MSERIQTEAAKDGQTKAGDYHFRFGGYGTWKIKTYGTEGAARKAYLGWLDDLALMEKKFSHEAYTAILNERESVKNRALPIQCELKSGVGNPMVGRIWHEEPKLTATSSNTTRHWVTNYQLSEGA